MEGHAKKCVGRYCELANKTTQQLYNVCTPCIDDHQFKEEELKSVGELSKVCSQIVLKCLYLARIGRPDILWSVNKLARSITKWTRVLVLMPRYHNGALVPSAGLTSRKPPVPVGSESRFQA